LRARPLLTYEVPKRKGEGLHPRCEHGEPRVPKKEIRSIRAVSWQMLAIPRERIEHCQLSFNPFKAALSGIDCVSRSGSDGIFCIFIHRIKSPDISDKRIKYYILLCRIKHINTT
jgi:hypothetical protein